MQRFFETGQMSKARRNINVFSFDLKVVDSYTIEHPAEDFHMTGAHTLKERLALTVLVLAWDCHLETSRRPVTTSSLSAYTSLKWRPSSI